MITYILRNLVAIVYKSLRQYKFTIHKKAKILITKGNFSDGDESAKIKSKGTKYIEMNQYLNTQSMEYMLDNKMRWQTLDLKSLYKSFKYSGLLN